MILAIDPGPKESAFVLWDGSTIIRHHAIGPNADMLAVIQCNLDLHVAIEWIEGYGMTVGNETFHTCRWVGRFEQAAGGATLITRKEIKSHLCSNTTAKDVHIRQALIDRIGPVGTKKNPGPTFGIVGHEWAALACAVTWWDKYKEAR